MHPEKIQHTSSTFPLFIDQHLKQIYVTNQQLIVVTTYSSFPETKENKYVFRTYAQSASMTT